MNGSAVPALDALLTRHGVDLTADEVLGELDNALGAIPAAGAVMLSTPELEFLREHAGPRVATVIDEWNADDERQARARTAVRHLTDTVAGSVSIKEAAAILGVDRSRVSRRLTRNSLWAFDLHGNRRIPRWQFLGKDLLPGLDAVVPAIPHDASPAALDALMHTPQPDFADRTAIEYLADGSDPDLVAAFVSDLARW